MVAALAPVLERAVCTELAGGAARRRSGRPGAASRPAAELARALRGGGAARPRRSPTSPPRCAGRALAAELAGALLVTGSHYVLAPAAPPLSHYLLCEDSAWTREAGSELLSMMALVAAVVAAVILSSSASATCSGAFSSERAVVRACQRQGSRRRGEVDCPTALLGGLPAMALAIFGISNDGLNLVATLFILMLVVVWLALIVYTYLDAHAPHLGPVPGRLRDDRPPSSPTSAPPSTRSCARRSSSRTPTSASWRSAPPSCGCAS